MGRPKKTATAKVASEVEVNQTAQGPVAPTPAKPLPRIIGGICEFCGVNAARCDHLDAFRRAGMLSSGAAALELAKLYQNFPGLPRVINKICEYCGVDATDSARCIHFTQRQNLAYGEAGARKASGSVRGSGASEQSNGAKIAVAPSGDKEMDALMDDDDEFAENTGDEDAI